MVVGYLEHFSLSSRSSCSLLDIYRVIISTRNHQHFHISPAIKIAVNNTMTLLLASWQKLCVLPAGFILVHRHFILVFKQRSILCLQLCQTTLKFIEILRSQPPNYSALMAVGATMYSKASNPTVRYLYRYILVLKKW